MGGKRAVRAMALAGALITLTQTSVSPAIGKALTIQEQALAATRRPVVEVEALIKVKGDELDPRIEVSSYGATQVVSKGWLASTTLENSFLRAYIDRKTGKVSAQIYHVINYRGSGWKFFNRASYQSPDGLKEAEVSRVGSDVDCQRYGCYYTEELIVPIDFATLEAGAARYDPANPVNGLKYRLFAQSGDNADEGIPVNEIAAFVNVVRRNVGRSTVTPSVTPGP